MGLWGSNDSSRSQSGERQFKVEYTESKSGGNVRHIYVRAVNADVAMRIARSMLPNANVRAAW